MPLALIEHRARSKRRAALQRERGRGVLDDHGLGAIRAFRFAEPPEDGSPQETVYGANTMTYVKKGIVYGYTVLRDSRILISFDSEPGINYV